MRGEDGRRRAIYTPAHVLLAAAAFARPGDRARSLAALAGGLIPDLPVMAMVGWERHVAGRDYETIFRDVYRAEPWATVFALDHSAPLWLLVLALGLALRRPWLAVLAAAALLHVAFDLPLHHNDGRPHFWPLTGWVYESPLSYWDPARHGGAVGLAELALCAVLATVLWRRFRPPAARALIAAALAVEAAPRLLFPLLWPVLYAA